EKNFNLHHVKEKPQETHKVPEETFNSHHVKEKPQETHKVPEETFNSHHVKEKPQETHKVPEVAFNSHHVEKLQETSKNKTEKNIICTDDYCCIIKEPQITIEGVPVDKSKIKTATKKKVIRVKKKVKIMKTMKPK
ncbi:MAG: hypothetical protein QW350_05245, partial [Candidatus Aenigmatarchaeota archaeon]